MMAASAIEEEICNILKKTEFSLQIDESTMPGNEALLLAYVRFIQEENMVEEILFARPLISDTKGESIFKVVDYSSEKKEFPLVRVPPIGPLLWLAEIVALFHT